MKSPSEFTNCAKSIVSLFSTHSGKTNHSAPIGLSHSLSESPKNRVRIKKNALGPKDKIKNAKNKKKIRPSSSTPQG